MNYIIGKHAITEVLKHNPYRIKKVLCVRSKDPLLIELQERGILIQFVDRQHLTHIVRTDSHQSFIAIVTPRKISSLADSIKKSQKEVTSRFVMIDSITDPHNFGSILRAAECFGMNGVIWSKNRSSGITPVVTKVSSGASELLPLIEVSNLAQAIQQLAGYGYTILSTGLSFGPMESIFSFSFPQKGVLILGSEGKGVQKILQAKADYNIHIPMQGKISSLNVAQAAAVIFSFWSMRL